MSCHPVVVLPGPTAMITIENGTPVGSSFCVQGMCFGLGCVRITDMTTVTVSN